ncbi:MAG: ATP-grasp domain-containing protein [Bacteroidetes bacterium]|nr:ATP-grasp domain-containing protein [Bacteroidota bacterium]
MEKRTVLVTGIGGNVGQGILRNIISLNINIKIIGTGVEDFSGGNHLCDKYYKLAYSYDEKYISQILDVVKKEKIELIIPSTDFETYYLAKNRHLFSCPIAVSEERTCEIYLDKYLTYLHHQKHQIPFAKCVLPSDYKNEFKKCLAKPRKGRGSRGLIFNPELSVINKLKDEEYLIQELFEGEEITTAFYVTKTKNILGQITLNRTLIAGTTNNCFVEKKHDDRLLPMLLKITEHSDIYGAANLQSIVSKDGTIHPFEVNCRISGTNSIRSNFGFMDVKYTLQEYLLNEPLQPPVIIEGTATRILMDVIYPKQNINSISNNSSDFFIF